MASRVFNFCRLFTKTFQKPILISQREFKRHERKVAIAINERQKKYLESLTEQERHELGKRSNFLEWNYSAEVFAFGKRLQEEFHPELLVQAFTHRSYIIKEELKLADLGVKDPNISLQDNDKLAEEGEQIISDFVPRYVSHFYPRLPLESIKEIQSYLTSEEVLAHISKNLGTTFLILSADYPVQSDTYSKTLKAVIGALNKCQGKDRANLFVRDFIITQLSGKEMSDFIKVSNPLQVLTDILKRDGREAPEPRLIDQTAVNTILANYHVAVYSNKEFLGHCAGETIDIAVEMAAFDALRRLFGITESTSPITYDLQNVPESVSNLSLNKWHSAAFSKAG